MSKILISEELRQSLVNQIAHEKLNANIYLYMAAFLKNKGLNGLAKHFEEQHEEETGHSLMIYGLLTDLSADVIIPEIPEVNMKFESIVDLANAYLDREIITTESLCDIKQIAIDENNGVVEEFMRKMIAIQQTEYAEATDFIDNAELCGSDWWKVKVWSDAAL